MARSLFVFVQMEFPWVLGPADGRYLMRRPEDGEPERVIVIGTLGAPLRAAGAGAQPGVLARRRARRVRSVAPEPAPEAVSTTRVTTIDPVSLSAESQARAWLAELDREREVSGAIAAVNRVLHAHRIATADPYVHEVSPEQALVIRAGWGEGEQVADGLWAHANALPWHGGDGSGARRAGRRRDRTAVLRPQERLAAMLGARSAPLLCEELALRARGDLDQGRAPQAALELERALALAVAELHAEQRQDLAIRLAELEQLQEGVRAQAQAVLARARAAAEAGTARDAGAPDEEVLAHALQRLEAALRARTAAGV